LNGHLDDPATINIGKANAQAGRILSVYATRFRLISLVIGWSEVFVDQDAMS